MSWKNKQTTPNVTAKRLRSVLLYNQNTGVFIWRAATSKYCAWRVGSVAGSTSNDYIEICIDGRTYGAHRLAWLYVHGRWPIDQIDHADGDKKNNSLSNLREADHQKNEANKPLRKDNTSGLKGAYYHSQTKKWRGRIGYKKKSISLGLFNTPDAAHAAYIMAAKRLFGEFTRAS